MRLAVWNPASRAIRIMRSQPSSMPRSSAAMDGFLTQFWKRAMLSSCRFSISDWIGESSPVRSEGAARVVATFASYVRHGRAAPDLAEFLLEVRHKNPPTKVRVSPPHESRRASVYRTARTTPLSRLTLLEKAARLGVAEAARQMGVSRQTVYRWRRRAHELEDRSCRPRRSPRRTAPAREAEGIGWQQVHVAIDAASRRSYLEFLPSFSADDCVGFVRRAVAHFDACGIRVRRVLTDNGTGHKRRFGEACAELGIRWTRTKP